MKKILCLLHLPPPLYGVTLLNKKILEGSAAENFSLDSVAINTAKRQDAIGRVRLDKVFNFIKIMIEVLKKLIRNRYHLCYFSLTPTGIGFYKDMILVVILKVFRVKMLYHLHGKGISLRRSVLEKMLYKLCFHNAKVIAISKLLLYDIEKYVDKKDVYILPNAVSNNLNDWEVKEIAEERHSESTVTILFLANIIRSKGVFIALGAARILKEKNYNFKLYFVGDWGDIKKEEFFNVIEQYNLNTEVQYLGFRENDDKYDLLKKSDIFICPTCNDIFPLVILEAMQFCLPVVATDEGGIPEIIEDNISGFIVPKQNISVLVDRIERLLIDEGLRIKMGKEGRKKFLSEYTFKNLEKRLISIFGEEIIS